MRPPKEDTVQAIGSMLELGLSDEEITDFTELISGLVDSYQTISDYEDSLPLDTPTGRESKRVAGEDPHNAWITQCDITVTDTGRLAGLDIAVKDNIAVAGVEMTCGSRVVETYVPQVDATLVSRLLSEGATIVGKTNLDDMAFSGNGHTSAFGPMLNPHNDEHLAGGSSGGSAIVIVTEEADAAIGSDQGGSVRVPASWSGIVGHKPTHGLVPYTGCIGIDNTIDHPGPMARDVQTVAEVLTVMAGRDSKDPRQPETVPTEDYAENLAGNAEDLQIAAIKEGFDGPDAEDAVNEQVWAALDTLADAGATIEEVSVPMHADGADIYTVSLAEGFFAAMQGQGLDYNWKGWYNTDWAREFGEARSERGGAFPPTVKLTLLAGAYASNEYRTEYYAKAMNLRSKLTDKYDDLLETYDVVAMPTTPMTANKWKPDQSRIEVIGDAWTNLANTSVFNMTGHPSISVPVNPVAELPVGLMLTGSHFEDSVVLNAADAVETG